MPRTVCLVWSFTFALLIGCGAAVADEGKGRAETHPSTLPSVFAEDLAHTPPYAYLVAVMRPAKMSELEGVQAIPGADLAGSNPVTPSEVERVVAAIYPKGANKTLSVGIVLQLRSEVPREKIVAWLSPQAQVYSEDQRIYAPLEWESKGMVLGFLDDHTILASYDPSFVLEQIGRANTDAFPPHSLAPAFADIDPAAHAVAVADVAKLTHFFQATSPDSAVPLIKQMEPLQAASSVKVAVNLSEPDGLLLHVEHHSAADAEELGKLARTAMFSKATGLIATFREVLGEDFAEQIHSVEQRVTAILEQTTLQSNETSFTIKSRELPPAADALELVTEFVALHLAQLRTQAADLRFGWEMQHLGLAIHNYHEAYRKLPGNIMSGDGQPLLSWRVALLPFISENNLYGQFRLDEPWDSEHNLEVMKQTPQVYRSRGKREFMKTSVQWVRGPGTGGAAKSFAEVQGLSNALALIESDELVQWTRPVDFVFDPEKPGAKLRPSGSFGILYDGLRVHLSPDTDADLLRSAFLNDGQEFDVEPLRYHPNARFSLATDSVRFSDEQLAKLLAGLDSEKESEVADALHALGKPQPKSPDPRAQTVVDKATELVDGDSPLLRAYALRVILAWRRHANVSWRPIAHMLEDPYEANRWLAIEILKDFPEPELVQAMLRLPLHDRDVANPVLYNDYASIAAGAAVPLLDDAEFIVRRRACHLIEETGNASHITKLESLRDDENETVREAAEAAVQHLQQLGPLAAAVEEFDGDVTAAVKQVASDVQTDEDGHPAVVDLSEFDTSYRLLRSDFPVLGKLSRLKSLKLTYSTLMASDVAHLKDLPLEELEIDYCSRLDDTVADSLRGMTTLQSLDIQESNVGDRTAAAIGQLENLKVLNIATTRITDKGLAELGKLRQLQSLNLSDTRVTDKGLAVLAGHTELRELYLLDTGITDAAIEHLQTLQGLQFMNLYGSELSPEGFARLRAALPNCRGLEIE